MGSIVSSQYRFGSAKLPVTVELSLTTRTDSRPASLFSGKRVHFIGIGGTGMSGLASMLLDCGAIVSGSDATPNAPTFKLIERGVKVSRDQIGELLSGQIDLVVRSAAIKDDHPEMIAARALKLQTIKYAQLLGLVMKERDGIAVAGTHGKSTTTAMIAYALTVCGESPSFVVGGTVPQLGGGSASGQGKTFVAEACEFDRSFHNLHPKIALITNVEEDHLDCYKNISEIIESFNKFARLVPQDGLILANGNDANVAKSLQGINAPIETVSINGETTWCVRPTGLSAGCHLGDVYLRGQRVARLELQVPGLHNLYNATMAMAACHAAGVDLEKAALAIGQFLGVDRRCSEIGEYNGAKIVDDYGHHPTEVDATLEALRERYNPKRLICVFQPHQHSRTRFLLEDFATSFSSADLTIMADIYFVRDSQQERHEICAQDLVNRIEKNGQKAVHIPEFGDIVAHLKRLAQPGDLIVTMGAGNVWEIGRELAQ